MCPVCGAAPVTGEHCKPERRTRKAGSVRGEAQKLPAAVDAAPLFSEALDNLAKDIEFMERDYESKSGRGATKEYLQDGRFFQYTREEAFWARGLGRTRITPAGQSPGNGLTRLIAAYLLVHSDPEPLIEKLHPDPDSLDREKLREHIEGYKTAKAHKPGLLTKAEQVARLIRGADLRPGANTGELDVGLQIVCWHIRRGKQEGRSNEEIAEFLTEESFPISEAQVESLCRLDLPDPLS